MKDYKKIYQEWLTNPYFDEATKNELRAIEMMRMRLRKDFTRILPLEQQGFVELLVRASTE